jgi:hypothetical protein
MSKKHILKQISYVTLAVFFLSFSQLVLLSPKIVHADSGLQLQWNLDEGSGTTANDFSGNNNNGTLFNGPTYVPGEYNLGVALNGVNQYIQSNTPLASLGTVNQPYALSAWVKVAPGVTAGNIVHISSLQNGGAWCIPFLRLQNDVFTATGWYNSQAYSAVGTTQVQSGVWYQVLTSWDPTNGLRLFVNGNQEAQTPQAGYSAHGSPVYFSLGLSGPTCANNQGFLNGVVDDGIVYDRALTSTDIQNISSPYVKPATLPNSTAITTDQQVSQIKSPDTGYGSPQNPSYFYFILSFSVPVIFILIGNWQIKYKGREKN